MSGSRLRSTKRGFAAASVPGAADNTVATARLRSDIGSAGKRKGLGRCWSERGISRSTR